MSGIARWGTALMVMVAITSAACEPGALEGEVVFVSGQVTRGPMCPVERADSPCPDEPADVVLVFERQGARTIDIRTGADGTYEVELLPGRYVVRIEALQGGPGGTVTPTSVVVDASGTEQDFTIDTGIR